MALSAFVAGLAAAAAVAAGPGTAPAPAPGWETMRAAVHAELRKRFLDDCLRRDCVVTFLDS